MTLFFANELYFRTFLDFRLISGRAYNTPTTPHAQSLSKTLLNGFGRRLAYRCSEGSLGDMLVVPHLLRCVNALIASQVLKLAGMLMNKWKLYVA